MRGPTAILLVTALVSSPLAAQTVSDSVRHRNDCRLAEQVLDTGRPAPHRDWARQVIHTCDASVWGRAAGGEIKRLASSSDTALLGATWGLLHLLRDSVAIDAALEVASSKSSDPTARLYALAGLFQMKNRRSGWTTEELVTLFYTGVPARRSCVGPVYGGIPVLYMGVPPTPDWREQITALGEELRHDMSEPAAVRQAGTCLSMNTY
jgi:hypothetical protein